MLFVFLFVFGVLDMFFSFWVLGGCKVVYIGCCFGFFLVVGGGCFFRFSGYGFVVLIIYEKLEILMCIWMIMKRSVGECGLNF